MAVWMEDWDMIRILNCRGMHHITDAIFSFLDFEDLRRAASASSIWRKAITEGNLWKKLLDRNVVLLPEWRRVLSTVILRMAMSTFQPESPRQYHQTACCLVGDSLQSLKKNWTNLTYTERKSEFGQPFSFDYSTFDMNSQWIVRGQPDNHIVIRNRWTLQIDNILELPIVQITFNNGLNPRIRSVKVNEDFIVVSFFWHTEVVIWNIKTRELLGVVEGEVTEMEDVLHEEENHGLPMVYFQSYGHCLSNNLLLNCWTKIFEESCTFTLRRLSTSPEEEPVLLYRKVINGPIHACYNLAMDSTYIVLFLARREELGLNRTEIEIRATSSFELINTIRFDSEAYYQFHYLNGIVATARAGKSIKIWNVSSGACIRSITCRDNISSIRLVSDKFIVSCDAVGKIKIWDLQAILNQPLGSSRPLSSSLLLKTVGPPQTAYEGTSMSALMQADEFQIAVVLQFDRSSTFLYVKDFLGEGMEEQLLEAQQLGSSLQSNIVHSSTRQMKSDIKFKNDGNKPKKPELRPTRSSSSRSPFMRIKDFVEDECEEERPRSKKRKYR